MEKCSWQTDGEARHMNHTLFSLCVSAGADPGFPSGAPIPGGANQSFDQIFPKFV